MTKLYEFNGQMLTRGDIARLGNLPWYIVDQRLRYGWSVERIINTPVKQIKTTRPKQDICDEMRASGYLYYGISDMDYNLLDIVEYLREQE